MTKDEFFEKHRLEGSLAILDLDENDEQSEFCYQALLHYRELPFDECVDLFLDGEELTEREFLEWIIDELDAVIIRARNAKRFIKKRHKTIKEDTM